VRIGLDARYTTDHFPGIGRYTLGLARGLAELALDHHLILIVNPHATPGRYDLGPLARLPNVEFATLAAGPFGARQQLALPALARRLNLDLLHSPYYIRPYFGLPCPSVVTIHDLIGWHFPHTLSWRGRLFYRLSMTLAVRTATIVITVSESARADLSHIYGLRPSQLAVTLEAGERHFQPQPPELVTELRTRYNLPASYVLYLGSAKPHKNLVRLVRAWARVVESGASAGVQLVLAGHAAGPDPELNHLIATRRLAPHLRFLPNLADSDLPALYSGATIFVFPSYYEGFGLPPLEAMACGAPVLCAHAASLPEVVGEAALTVDPFSVIEIADGLSRLLGNPLLRRDLRTRGLARARSFSWRRTALATLAAYERAASL
jgi:glycosyltransferase involved in cell wall biosynthesis